MFLGIDEKPGSAPALVDSAGARMTYGELCEHMVAVGSALPERTLAFCLCRNVVGCAVGYLAMVDAGIVPVMLNATMNRAFLRVLFEKYRPGLVWALAGLDHGLSGAVKYGAWATS